jgi:hypothetical protein
MFLSSYLEQDLIFFISFYLDLPDILSFKSCSKSFYSMLSNEIFWLNLINIRISKIQTNLSNFISNQWANKFLSLLKLNLYYDLYCFFSQFAFPLICSYEKVLPLTRDASAGIYEFSDQSHRGGLMRISCQPNNNILSLESSEDNWLYEIQYRSHQIIACDSHSNHIYTIKCSHGSCINSGNGNGPSHSDDPHQPNHNLFSSSPQLLFYNHQNEIISQYHPLYLEEMTTPLPFQHLIPQDVLPQMNKLYNGVYGPHGIETIYLNFERYQNLSSSIIHRLPSRDRWETSEYAIIGRKITGDANVPAQQISFILNPMLAIKNTSRLAQSKLFLPPSSLLVFSVR